VVVGSDGTISTTNEGSGPTDISVTVLGYFTDGTQDNPEYTYASVYQQTLVDTRGGIGAPMAQVPAGGSLTVQVGGVDGIPADAAGAALFLGVANATATGDLSAYPSGETDPDLSVLSYSPGETVRDLYFGALSASGQLTVTNHGTAPIDVIIDTRGYLVSPTSATETGASYTGLTPARILDTRSSSPLPAGGSVTFTATGVGGVPSSGVAAVQESVAALTPTATGYLTVYPAGGSDPNSPTVNFTAGDGQDNDQNAAVVSSVSATGQETITNHSTGTVNVVVSVRGYWTPPSAPDPPQTATVATSGSSAYLDWVPPDTDGGAALTGYTISVTPGGQTITTSATATTAEITGLAAGSSYTFEVTANNLVGQSSSVTADAVAAAPPSAPPEVSTTSVADEPVVQVTWQPPVSAEDNGPNGLTGYAVSLYSGSTLVASDSVDGETGFDTFSNVNLGTAYTVQVSAQNQFGSGQGATSATVVAGQPEPVKGLEATPGDGYITLDWAQPSSNPANYQLTATPANGGAATTATASGSATSATVSGLTDGTPYDVTVSAQNVYGATATGLPGTVTPGAPGSQQAAPISAPASSDPDVSAVSGMTQCYFTSSSVGGGTQPVSQDEAWYDNWSGYTVHRSTQYFGNVTMHWVVPRLSTTSTNRWLSIWPGIGSGGSHLNSDGRYDHELVQAGTEQETTSTSVKTYFWWEIYPIIAYSIPIQNLSVSGGDRVGAHVQYVPDGQNGMTATFQLWNYTRGTSCGFSYFSPTLGNANNQAEFIAERPTFSGGSLPHLAWFGKLDVSSAKAKNDGTWRCIAGYQATRDIMLDVYGTTLATPKYQDSRGCAFHVTRSGSD
jgi:hypothetical protein